MTDPLEHITIDIEYVRKIGNLPRQVQDAMLEPHIQSATSFCRGSLGDRIPKSEEAARVKEAIACFAIANLLPVLNAFYLSNATKTPRQVAETDYVFYGPGETLKLVDYWKTRGWEILREVGRTSGSVSVTVI